MPTYNRRDGLRTVLEPLLEQDADEIVVVVDGSRDGSMELLQELVGAHPRLRPLFVENGGEMRARQAGAEHAGSDIVLFLDDDVRARPGLVAGHRARHRDGDHKVIVGYMPVRLPVRRRPGDGTTWLYAAEYAGRCRGYDQEPASVLRHLWAGNFSMRRDDVLTLGLADTEFRERYHPDRELGLRMLAAGFEGCFDRELAAEHLHSRSLAAFRRDGRSQGAARVELHRLHAERIGPLADDELARGAGVLAGAVAGLGESKAAMPVADAIALAAVVAGRLRLWGLEEIALRLLRRIEQIAGAAEARARSRHVSDAPGAGMPSH